MRHDSPPARRASPRSTWSRPLRETRRTFKPGFSTSSFGHLWQRPNLSRIDRRYVTIPCVGLSGAIIPIHSHVGSALRSGDISLDEMNEIVLQFSAYYGFRQGRDPPTRSSRKSGLGSRASAREAGI
jgi:hypothetical protein